MTAADVMAVAVALAVWAVTSSVLLRLRASRAGHRLVAAALVGVVLVAGSCADAVPTGAVVASVVDGDTVELDDGTRVRLIGIDTPEAGECGHAEAAAALAALVEGEQVDLVGEGTDRYGRLLRYVDVGGVDAGLEQIRAGFAAARYDSHDGYGAHDREETYHATEAAAPLPVCVPGSPVSDVPGVVSGGYPFCAAARADGAAPLREGDPGWNPELDRDGDGIACES